MTKLCSKCKRLLDESNFNWKIKNVKLAVHCKDCSRAYIRQHYLNNKQYYLNKALKRNVIVKHNCQIYIAKYLANHPCVDCGENDILVLEFDHTDRRDKDLEISKIIRRRGSLQKLIEEIDKCEVRCANCHRRKTENENNSWKLKYAPVV